MPEEMNSKRMLVISRLNKAGFMPRRIDRIMRLIDDMMGGHALLADVLVAAGEVCTVCDLHETHQRVAGASTCLAGEVVRYMDPSVSQIVGAPSPGPGAAPN